VNPTRPAAKHAASANSTAFTAASSATYTLRRTTRSLPLACRANPDPSACREASAPGRASPPNPGATTCPEKTSPLSATRTAAARPVPLCAGTR
jgi:hypothetical protein